MMKRATITQNGVRGDGVAEVEDVGALLDGRRDGGSRSESLKRRGTWRERGIAVLRRVITDKLERVRSKPIRILHWAIREAN